MLIFIAAIAVAAFAYFFVSYLFSRSAYKRATLIQRANATIDEAKRREGKVSALDQLRIFLLRNGWAGNLGPVAAGAGFLYLSVTLVMVSLGISSAVAALAAAPACLGASMLAVRMLEDKRQARFRHQLLQLMNQLASQIESGVGVEKALGAIVPQLDNPLGEELERALNETRASKDLIEALGDIAERYQSRALTMLIASLEIDRKIGGSLSPVLRQAASLLEREFELTAEARAEIAQTRGEFYIVAGIILGICFYVMSSSGAVGRAAYSSAVGIVLLILAGANFLLGVLRVLGVLRRAKGRS